MNLSSVSDNIVYLIFVGIGIFFLFEFAYKRKLNGISDPFHIAIAYQSLNIAGFLSVYIFDAQKNSVYEYYFYGIILWFFIFSFIFVFLRKKDIDLRLKVSCEMQYSLSVLALFLSAVHLFGNYIYTGNIPLFTGSDDRANFGDSLLPSLFVLQGFLGTLSVMLLSLSDLTYVRYINFINLIFFSISSIFSGSKVALIYLAILFLQFHYCRFIKMKSIYGFGRKISIKLILTILFFVVLTPFITTFVNPAGSFLHAMQVTFARFLLGYDGLILSSVSKLDLFHSIDQSIFSFWFYPLFKRIFYTPDFQSAGQALTYLLSNNYEYALSGMNPNSNLLLELVLLNNVGGYFSFLILSAILYGVFQVWMFNSQGLSGWGLICMAAYGFNPFIFIQDCSFAFNLLVLLLLFFLFSFIFSRLLYSGNRG